MSTNFVKQIQGHTYNLDTTGNLKFPRYLELHLKARMSVAKTSQDNLILLVGAALQLQVELL